MSFGEDAGEPGIAGAGDVFVFVREMNVIDDLRGGGVGGADGGTAVEETFGLVEVDGLSDVGGDHGVVPVALSDAIDFDEKEDGDAVALQLAGYFYGLRGSPTVTVEDDSGRVLLD